jgi:hypothetical protein
MNALDSIRQIAEEVIYPPEPRAWVIPTRYPYTYSADFLRSHSEIIPDEYLKIQELAPGQPLSRAQAAGIKSSWAKDLGVDERELASVFADAYIKENQLAWRETP